MIVSSHPLGTVYAKIYACAREVMSAVDAQVWMFKANDALGGRSPLQAIRAGDAHLVSEMMRMGAKR